MQVREIVRIKGTALFTATAQQTLSSAIDMMADQDIGSLVIVDGDRLVGMLTFREILLAHKKYAGQLASVTIGEVMNADPVSVSPELEVNDLRSLLINRHSRYLPVMEDGKLVGVISFLDVAKAVLQEQSLENKMLKSYIKNWPEDSDSAQG